VGGCHLEPTVLDNPRSPEAQTMVESSHVSISITEGSLGNIVPAGLILSRRGQESHQYNDYGCADGPKAAGQGPVPAHPRHSRPTDVTAGLIGSPWGGQVLRPAEPREQRLMDMKVEVVILPVSDVDRAKRFYQRRGFRLDIDHVSSEDFRVVQLTPPGSECSIIIDNGISSAAPGSVEGLHLVVVDIEAARAELVGRGVEVEEVLHDAGRVVHHAGLKGRVLGPDPEDHSYGEFASFNDPDGNGWLLQEVTKRAPPAFGGRLGHQGASKLVVMPRVAAIDGANFTGPGVQELYSATLAFVAQVPL
jgi:catechol 2,3-dioxygenase-like lactoylglutathione lyase family enzyme